MEVTQQRYPGIIGEGNELPLYHLLTRTLSGQAQHCAQILKAFEIDSGLDCLILRVPTDTRRFRNSRVRLLFHFPLGQ
jgi:hypothetical protein